MIEMKHVNINFGDQVIFNDAHLKHVQVKSLVLLVKVDVVKQHS